MKRLARNDKEREQIKRERNAAKQMEPQYWLEIVDDQHRYGSNLKYYHQRWNETDTSENFFFVESPAPGFFFSFAEAFRLTCLAYPSSVARSWRRQTP